MKPDYLKIILAGIPIGFITWFILIFPSIYIASFLEIRDYWFYVSIFFTLVVITGYFLFCIKYSLKVHAAIIENPAALKSIKEDFKCELCGNLIRDKSTAKILQQSISGKNILCCSECYIKKNNGSYKSILVISIAQVFFGIILVYFAPEEKIGWFLLNLIMVSICSIVMIIPHEIGHVFVAKIFGAIVPAVIFGKGKSVFTKQLLNVSWDFRNIPFGGITVALFLDHIKYRRKLLFVILGGPLVNLLFLLLLLWLFPTTKLFTDIFSLKLSFASAFFYANFIDLFFNMIPNHVETSIGRIPNDGLSLIMLPFLTENEIKQQIMNNKNIISQTENLGNLKYNKGVHRKA